MSETVQSASYVTANGWTCWSCSAWVPNGATHFCPTQPTTRFTYQITPTPRLSDEDIERIARRLFELLAERLKGTA